MSQALLNILILNWNNKETLSNCILSIRKSNFNDYDITVIDNGSTDGSVNDINKKFKDISIIEIDAYSTGFVEIESRTVPDIEQPFGFPRLC